MKVPLHMITVFLTVFTTFLGTNVAADKKFLAKVNPDATLDFPDYVKSKGYVFEKHLITTEDGYINTYFRIQGKGQSSMESKPVIYCQHGLLDSADTFIVNDEDKAPGLVLANSGYDVWVGNIRGNKYSREHTHLNPDRDDAYWQFSWQNMSKYDLPAAFEYITNRTKRAKIHYIGHSQGSLVMFAALAEKDPVILSKLQSFIALGPVWYLSHMNSEFLRIIANSPIEKIFEVLRIQEFLTPNFFTSKAFPIFCSLLPTICKNLVGLISDADPDLDNFNRWDVFIGHFPGGTSVMNMLHFQQMVLQEDYRLQKFDYGTELNMKMYGQPTAPDYNLGNIQFKVNLFAGTSDKLADPTDVAQLAKDFGPIANLQNFNMGHMTFLWAQDASYLSKVKAIIQANEEIEQLITE